jgi:hypothetical protein
MERLEIMNSTSKIIRTLLAAVMIIVILSLAACGGGSKPITNPTSPTQGLPLDPQGNWLFVFSGSKSLNIAGQLYELSPPVVTSNPMGPVGNNFICAGSFTFAGQASGTNTITMTATQINTPGVLVKVSLTGTIADDQAHMSGTWTVSQSGDCLASTDSGTWTAQLLTAVTGNWSGTVSNGTNNLTVTAALTENVDQTSATMGQVTGTVTLLGSPCFASSDAMTLPPWNSTSSPGVHGGETLIIATAPDSNGVHIETVGTVTPDGTTFTPLTFTIGGGACDGQSFTGPLAH